MSAYNPYHSKRSTSGLNFLHEARMKGCKTDATRMQARSTSGARLYNQISDIESCAIIINNDDDGLDGSFIMLFCWSLVMVGLSYVSFVNSKVPHYC